MSDNTNITAAVIDSDGQTWAGAAWSANVVGYRGPGLPTYLTTGQPIAAHKDGFLDVAGNLAVTLAANDAIAPYGTEWELSIQPLASVQPSTLRFKASGASLDISTLASQQIVPPRVESSALRVSYADGQIYPLPKIPAFYVTAEGGLRFWNGQAWATGGGGVGEFLPLSGGALTGPLSVAGLLSLAQGLYANGNVTATGNVSAATVNASGNIAATGNVSANNLTTTGNQANLVVTDVNGAGPVLSVNTGGMSLYGGANILGGLTAQNATIQNALNVAGPLVSGGPTLLNDGTDMDNLSTQSGFFYIGNGAVNAPAVFGGNISGMYCIQWIQSGSTVLQFAWGMNDGLGRLYTRKFRSTVGWEGWQFANGIENIIVTPQSSGGIVDYQHIMFNGFYVISDTNNNASVNQPPVSDYRIIFLIVQGLDDQTITVQIAFAVATHQMFIRINWYGWSTPWQQVTLT